MKFLREIILTIILLFIFFPASAENNIAYLDISLMMTKSLAGQSIQKQLETKHKKNEKFTFTQQVIVDSFHHEDPLFKKKLLILFLMDLS